MDICPWESGMMVRAHNGCPYFGTSVENVVRDKFLYFWRHEEAGNISEGLYSICIAKTYPTTSVKN